MTNPNITLAIGLMALFFTSSAVPQGIAQNLSEGARPIVLTVDGVSPMSEITGGRIGGFARVDSYLSPSVESWGIASHIEHAIWNGDSNSTDLYIERIKDHIEILSRRANDEGRQLVVIGHSWGSVFAARAIVEIGQARVTGGYKGNTEPLAIGQLVTLGSPLNAQGDIYKNRAAKEMGGTEYGAAVNYIGSWKNYWLESDDISGSIAGASNTQFPETELLGSVGWRSHDWYFENSDFWTYVGSDIAVDAIRFARTSEAEGNEVSKPVKIDENIPDLYGLQIGMTAPDVVAVLQASHPKSVVAHVTTNNPMFKAESDKRYMYKMGNGVIAINTQWYCEGLEGWHCTDAIDFRIDLADSEMRTLKVRMARPFGEPRSVVTSLEFRHTIRDNTRFVPSDFMSRKYGERESQPTVSAQQQNSDSRDNQRRDRSRRSRARGASQPVSNSADGVEAPKFSTKGIPWKDAASRYGPFRISVAGREVVAGGNRGSNWYSVSFELDRNIPERWGRDIAMDRAKQRQDEVNSRETADDPW